MKLDCATFEVFLLVIAQETKKENNCLIEGRTVAELARAFDDNYIKCGYVPRFVVDHCREILRQYERFSRATARPVGESGGASHPRIPEHFSLVVRENRT